MYKLMKSPGSIGRLTMKNRVVMPAMGVNLSARDGGVSDDIIAFYEARAAGGVGLIISEITRVVDGAGAGEPCQLAARSLRDVPDLQRLTDAIHKYDTKLFIQLQHPGAMASPYVTGVQPVAPSAKVAAEGVLHELTTAECEELVQAFITGAQVAQMAGADGVELHGAHGYLINEFLSPATNFRDDRYGGSLEGRLCFAVEILKGIKNRCGTHFPVTVRINAEEAIQGGITLDEAKRIAAGLEQAGADAVNVSCLSIGCIEPGTYRQGWKKYMAAAIREAVNIPVIAVCNIKEPETGEQLLEEGVCDFIGVGRGHLADPEWCNKTFQGRKDEIRLCIGCLACFNEICKLHRVKCAVNPVTGREREYGGDVIPAKAGIPLPVIDPNVEMQTGRQRTREQGDGRTVAVIGGGPAGIEAALVLKKRGFTPVIFEENTRLGGALNIADKGCGKTIITKYTDSLIRQVELAGIEVRYGRKATVEDVRALNPCGVFVACGAVPFKPPITGINAGNICTAEDVLTGKCKPKGAVAIIGSGMTGLETGEKLTSEGCKVTFVEMLESVGCGIYPSIVEDLMHRMNPHNPCVLTGHRLEQIATEKITLNRLSDNKKVEISADWVVLAMGVRPRKDIAETFRAAFDNVIVIGDANRCGCILDATQDAHGKAVVFFTS